MKLLITTQKLDSADPVLGFFHDWVVRFAAHVDELSVICLSEGAHALPANVHVYSLGKEHGRKTRLANIVQILKISYAKRASYDAVFVHMNPEYLLAAGWLWRILGKKVGLWYTHKSVSGRLRLGAIFATVIFTASAESLRLHTKKKQVVGHGIVISTGNRVVPPLYPPVRLVSIGRISRVKRLDLLIDALTRLREQRILAELTIAGAPVDLDGEEYLRELMTQVTSLGIGSFVHFIGAINATEREELFKQSHLLVHSSDTGSLDKAALEPLSSGVPLVTVNKELGQLGLRGIFWSDPTGSALAGAIRRAVDVRVWEDGEIRAGLEEYVCEHHNLDRLVPLIVKMLSS